MQDGFTSKEFTNILDFFLLQPPLIVQIVRHINILTRRERDWGLLLAVEESCAGGRAWECPVGSGS